MKDLLKAIVEKSTSQHEMMLKEGEGKDREQWRGPRNIVATGTDNNQKNTVGGTIQRGTPRIAAPGQDATTRRIANLR